MCLCNKVKQGNHLNPKFIREEEEVRDKVIIEMDPEITVDKDKILVKIDVVITIEEMDTCKILVEIIAEIEAEILPEIIIMTGAGSRERTLSPRRYNNNDNNRQNMNSRFRPRSRSRSNSRVRTNRDRIRCYRC